MKVAVLKYNAGNIKSVLFALERLNQEAIVSDDENILKSADKVIFPGVGHGESALKHLAEQGLISLILDLKRPVLGICLGLQLLCKDTQETHENKNLLQALGIFSPSVKKFVSPKKIPHMGWNGLKIVQNNSPLLKNIKSSDYFYFVHSYYAELCTETSASCEYDGTCFSAVLEKDNFYAVQFHPEKSADAGQKILENFLSL